MSTPTMQAAVEQRLATLNMLEAAKESGDDLQLLAAEMNAEAALHHLVMTKQLQRLHDRTGPAPSWNAEWREDDVLPVFEDDEQPLPRITEDGVQRCSYANCRGRNKLDADGRCPWHPVAVDGVCVECGAERTPGSRRCSRCKSRKYAERKADREAAEAEPWWLTGTASS